MEEYILHILHKNNRLVIPGFGAFIVMRRKPLTVVFNEFLQHSDNELIDIIVYNENCTINEAKEKIDQFIRLIKDQLDKKEPFVFKELGSLIKTPVGKITFKNPTLNDEEADLLNVKEFDLEIDEKSKRAVTKKSDSKRKTARNAEKQKDTAISKRDGIKKKPLVSESKTISKAHDAQTHDLLNKENITKPYILTKNAKVDHKPSTLSKKSATIWTIILLFAAGALGYYYFFGLPYNIKSLNFGKYVTFTKTDTIESSILEDLAQSDTSISMVNTEIIDTNSNIPSHTEAKIMSETTHIRQQEKLEPKYIPGNVNKQITKRGYYIIAGVFKSEDNAEKLASSLRKKGFNSEKFGKIGELYGVCYSKHDTKAEADTALSKIKRDTDRGAWIKYME